MAKKTQKILLSEHTLDINHRSYDIDLFDFSEIEDYVKQLTGDREYQYKAIRDLLIYLWGGRYKTVLDLAKENFTKPGKDGLRHRFESKDHFFATLPLPDRLSGVCHMATGTGKTYVMFAIAYLSIIMDKVDRVLVIGPSSTVIEQGLTEKFKEYLYGETGNKLKEFLPEEYRQKVVKLLNANDPIEDQSIVIENVNAVYAEDRNAIGDTLFARGNRVLVLSDEVHHAYTHLQFSGGILGYDFDPEEIKESSRVTTENEERLWMKFLREKPIKWHLGFTGTPYNQDEYFTDVIYNYSLKDAIEDKYIKKVDAVLKVDGDEELTKAQRYYQIIKTHFENKEKYSYPDKNGNPRLKPITIFINKQQSSAKKNAAEFAKALATYLGNHIEDYKGLGRSDLEVISNSKIITVTSDTNKSEYEKQLQEIEELDPNKVGGQVEFIFAVNKLSEGWDVDNVFQIVPSEERVFNSKLLISQVLGRGLRLPRNPEIPFHAIQGNYPRVTVTNHEKFGKHVKELYDQVTECELRFHSRTLGEEQPRSKHHFNVFNISYLPTQILEDKKESSATKRTLTLDPQPEKLDINIEYLEGSRSFAFDKEFVTVDQMVADITRKFKYVVFEHEKFDFGDNMQLETLPSMETIRDQIKQAMNLAGIDSEKISVENKKKIELYFNQFIKKGSKKVVRKNIEGNLYGISTKSLPVTTVNIGRLDSDVSIFLSEDYARELQGDDLFILKELEKQYKLDEKKRSEGQQSIFSEKKEINSEHIRQFINDKNIFLVNPSLFRTPQSAVLVTHKPEREFIFQLINHSKMIDSWYKSPDAGFYSLEYEYWKKGKDRVKSSFNPDFFIKTSISQYANFISNSSVKEHIKKLENEGIEDIIFSIEIKGEDDYKDETVAKNQFGKDHFVTVNRQLRTVNPANFPQEFRDSYRQHYVFELIRLEDISSWFKRFKEGVVILG